MDFTQNTFFVGMDVGKSELVLAILTVEPSRKTTQIIDKFENTQQGHQKIIKWLKQNKTIIRYYTG